MALSSGKVCAVILPGSVSEDTMGRYLEAIEASKQATLCHWSGARPHSTPWRTVRCDVQIELKHLDGVIRQ